MKSRAGVIHGKHRDVFVTMEAPKSTEPRATPEDFRRLLAAKVRRAKRAARP